MSDNRAALAAALIAVFEGERLTAYQDTGSVWTLGLGHTAGVKQGDACTHEQAVAWMETDMAPLFHLVSGITGPMKAAAMLSFGYNTGYGTLSNVLAGRDTMDNPHHTMDRKGNVLPGLVARRRLEIILAGLGV